MMKGTKNGVTLASLVIYIVLFTGFTIFVSITSTNMNERLFDNRGEAINYSYLNKLQYNLEDSSMNSQDVSVTENEITYSNGDRYTYNADEGVIYKNEGILCLNVSSFTVSVETGVSTKKLTLNITLNKYLNVIEKSIITCVEAI